MVSQGDRVVVLYPVYFDSRRSRAEGRRVPRNLAVSDPTLEELSEAAQRADLRVEVEPRAAHPSATGRAGGRVLIVGGGQKTQILKDVGRELKRQRS